MLWEVASAMGVLVLFAPTLPVHGHTGGTVALPRLCHTASRERLCLPVNIDHSELNGPTVES